MVIEIKCREDLFIFSDWKCSDPKFMWYRDLININKENAAPDQGAGITLLCFNQIWYVRFFASHLYEGIIDVYNILYPRSKDYLSAEEAMKDIDKFLSRACSLKVFL